jgi:hypothetical protein
MSFVVQLWGRSGFRGGNRRARQLGRTIQRHRADQRRRYRTIKWKPRIKKNRPGPRRYFKRRKRSLYRPWDTSSCYYDDDQKDHWSALDLSSEGLVSQKTKA